MISIAIVDDQQMYKDKIAMVLKTNFDNIKIFTYDSVYNITQPVDLLLLDVFMPDIDGIDFSKQNRDIRVIFVTNNDTRIKEAFGSNVYGYVSKDNLEKELIVKVTEVIDILKKDTYVQFKIKGINLNIKMNDIIYCQYLGGRKVAIVYKKQSIIVGGSTLKKIIEKLDDRFIKINKETIINKYKISDFQNQYLYLKGMNCKFEVSVRNKMMVKKCFYE